MVRLLNRTFWCPDLAVDLGTATIRVASGIHGVCQHESRTANRKALRSGVIVDRDVTADLLSPLLYRAKKFGILKPRVVACAPSDVDKDEREAVRESVAKAGAASVVVVPEPLAAAIGAGVDVADSNARLLLDIGEGVTDCAVITSGKLVESLAVRVGCGELRRRVQREVFWNWGVRLSEEEAERIIRLVGAETFSPATPEVEIADSVSDGMNRSGMKVPVGIIRTMIEPTVRTILAAAAMLLRDIPPSLGCQIIHNGICLAGGGALLPGMRERVEKETGIATFVPPNPLHAVVRGARAMLPVVSMLNQWRH